MATEKYNLCLIEDMCYLPLCPGKVDTQKLMTYVMFVVCVAQRAQFIPVAVFAPPQNSSDSFFLAFCTRSAFVVHTCKKNETRVLRKTILSIALSILRGTKSER